MSTAQRKEVILDHQEKAKNGHPIHVALRARLQEAVRAQGGGARPKGTKSHSFGSGGGENAHEEEENQDNYYERGMTKDETDILRLRKNNIETPIIKRQTRIMSV